MTLYMTIEPIHLLPEVKYNNVFEIQHRELQYIAAKSGHFCLLLKISCYLTLPYLSSSSSSSSECFLGLFYFYCSFVMVFWYVFSISFYIPVNWVCFFGVSFLSSLFWCFYCILLYFIVFYCILLYFIIVLPCAYRGIK